MKTMTRINALAIIIGYIESEENASHWERLTEDYADDDESSVPGVADILKCLGVTDAEIREASRRDNKMNGRRLRKGDYPVKTLSSKK